MSTKRRDDTSSSNKHKHRRDIVSRVRFIYAALMIVGLGISVVMVWVQMVSPAVKHNAAILEEGVFRTTELEAHRGAILTLDGEPLAISSLRYNVEMDFASEGIRTADSLTYYKNADSLAKLLALHFTAEDAKANDYKYVDANGYLRILREQRTSGRNRAYKLFPRLVTIDEWNELRNYPILNGNLGFVYRARPEEKRLYPLGDVARQTIGRYTPVSINDSVEIEGTGLEHHFNKYLTGSKGSVKEQWIAHGFWTRVEDPDNRLPEDGCNVVTTIDAGLQRAADEYLRATLQKENASFGVAIVMEVETGNIKAMVNLGSGRERGDEYTERVENHALKSKMMPGSTMKLATTMALLEIGGYNLGTKVNTEHSRNKVPIEIGKSWVEDTHDAGEDTDGMVTLIDGFAHSSNVYYAKAVYEKWKDNPKEYTDYLASLRFNDYIGLEAYGEIRSAIPMAGTPAWNDRGSTGTRLPRIAYGYEMETPPIHMITFFNGVANEGRMVAPRFVDHVERDGEVVERMPVVTLIPRMCSKRTLTLLDSCLVAAAERPSTQYHFKEYPSTFGCKTGTAQMWSNFVSRGRIDYEQMKNGLNESDRYYYGSICCIMPADKPKYTILVGICKQKMFDKDNYYGISLAGPVANDIMCYIYANDPTLHAKVENPPIPYNPTQIKAGNSDNVAEISRRLGAHHSDASHGRAWSKAEIDVGGNSSVVGIDFEEGKVPDVRGMGLSDALYLLESQGFIVTHSGYGAVTSQSTKAGKEIGENPTIHLTLKP